MATIKGFIRSICSVNGITRSDECAGNHHQTAVSLSCVELFSIVQLTDFLQFSSCSHQHCFQQPEAFFSEYVLKTWSTLPSTKQQTGKVSDKLVTTVEHLTATKPWSCLMSVVSQQMSRNVKACGLICTYFKMGCSRSLVRQGLLGASVDELMQLANC